MRKVIGLPHDGAMDVDRESRSRSGANLALFEELSLAKVHFFDAVIENCQPSSPPKSTALRQDSIFEIAKFYYLLKLCKIDGPGKLRDLAIRHNQRIEGLLQKMRTDSEDGVTANRLRSALFDSEQKLGALEATSGTGRIKLSQSSIAKFLVEHMSSETSRTGVKVLCEAGYLHHAQSSFSAIFVQSTGHIERHFETYAKSVGKGG